jgi:hypothetical protein
MTGRPAYRARSSWRKCLSFPRPRPSALRPRWRPYSFSAPRRHGRVAQRLPPRFSELLRELAAGNPVLVLQDVGLLAPQWHYAVVNGFDYGSGTIYLRSGLEARQQMSFTGFEHTWRKAGYWAFLVPRP